MGSVELVRTLADSGSRRAPLGAAPATTTRIPRATYRVQLHRAFDFARATALVPYLARLGVSHLYCSPALRARAGSTHGYDIIDHTEINPELGGRDAFEALVAALKANGMGLVFDVVPNHMGIMGADNAWWLDLLENGPASAHADFFDIDWHPLDPTMANRVLVPVLGDHYGLVLERGELRLEFAAARGELSVRYYEHRFPVDPHEYPRVLGLAVNPSARDQGSLELASLAAAFGHLPPRDDTHAAAVDERNRDKEVHKRRLARLAAEHPETAAVLQRAIDRVNGTPGERGSLERLHELLEAQAYRLAYWRVASDEINYRRFFDINDLAALRMENDAVFDATHELVLELAASGKIDGLRIDHPDGLYDPAKYFERLQQRYARLAEAQSSERAGATAPRRLWVVAEKILAGHERLPESWPIHGTTGYRFAAVVNGLFVDGAAKAKFERTWRSFTGEAIDFTEAAYRGKRTILRTALASELTVLASELLRLARADRRTRDYTFNTLRQALAEVIACFPVYRTYLGETSSRQDRRFIDWAVAQARRRSGAADVTIFEFVRAALLARPPEGSAAELAGRYRSFAMKFQQVTAPVAAKGVEDTTFYAYAPLGSLNEVGTGPDMFGMTVSAFHGASGDRALHWPHTVLATSTHDNKRSEDVRARIDVLSEMPAAWRLLLRRWSRMNRSKKRSPHGEPAPSRSDEYLLYQTLLGTLPATALDARALADYRARIEHYMVKAAREAKRHSSWINVNADYERVVTEFVGALLGRLEGNLFLDDLREQVARIGWFGALNSLSMTLLKLASPGVPDLYQGSELFDLSLVDPDNRRPVDYALRQRFLDALVEMASGSAEPLGARVRALFDAPYDGRTKLWTVWRALDVRRRDPELFERGDYVPLQARGAKAAHVVAFARRYEGRIAIAVAGRLFLTLLGEPDRLPLGAQVWGDTEVDLAPLGQRTTLVNALTGEVLQPSAQRWSLAEAFATFPGALLH